MRLEMYRHLQQLSPRFYARTRLGDIMSRINNDIGEIQRIASEAALGVARQRAVPGGTVGLLAWLDLRLFAVTIGAAPVARLGARPLPRNGSRDEIASLRQRSADIGSFLIETLQAVRLVAASNAQVREVRTVPVAQRRVRSSADVDAAAHLLRRRRPRPGYLRGDRRLTFVYGGWRVLNGAMTVGTFVAFMACQMRLLSPLQALMGMYTSLATIRVSLRRVAQILDEPIEVVEQLRRAGASNGVRGDVAFEHVTLSYDRGHPVLDRRVVHGQGG